MENSQRASDGGVYEEFVLTSRGNSAQWNGKWAARASIERAEIL